MVRFTLRETNDGSLRGTSFGYTEFRVKVHNAGPFGGLFDTVAAVRDAIYQMIRRVKALPGTRGSRVFVSIEDEATGLSSQVDLMLRDNLTPAVIFQVIEKILSSSESLDLATSVFKFSLYAPIRGGARRTARVFTWASMEKQMGKSAYHIVPRNNECFGIALILGLSVVHPSYFTQLTAHRNASGTLVEWDPWTRTRRESLKGWGDAILLTNDHADNGVPLEDIHLYETKYKVNVRLVVYPGQREMVRNRSDQAVVGEEPWPDIWMLYVGPLADATAPIGHFFAIKDQKQHLFLNGHAKICDKCRQSVESFSHNCQPLCLSCRTMGCLGAGVCRKDCTVKCRECKLMCFDNDACKKKHKTICSANRLCEECSVYYRPTRGVTHRCGILRCSTCSEEYPEEEKHLCYQNRLTQYEQKKLIKMQEKDPEIEDLPSPVIPVIYYDFEAVRGPDNQQIPTIAVAWAAGEEEPCMIAKSAREFFDWVFTPCHKGTTFIAHNGAKYDVTFVKQYMLARSINSHDIRMGRAYVSVTVADEALKGLRFIDSYRFLSMSLASFSKTFNLPQSKGFFPYDFYTLENQHYVGPPPGREFFTQQAREDPKFDAFYAGLGAVYDIEAECTKYCIEDVALLRSGCEVYRKAHRENTQLELFKAMTGPAACKMVYNRRYMPERSIGLFNETRDTTEAYKWLAYCQWCAATPDFRSGDSAPAAYDLVLTPLNDPIALAKDQFDRIYIYRFCFATGCSTCYPKAQTINKFRNQSMGKLRKDYLICRDRWRSSHTVIETTNHSWISRQARKESLIRMYHFLDVWKPQAKNLVGPLYYRDALRGGRTEVFKKQIPRGTNASYVDFTSLYPAIQFGKARGVTPETYAEDTLFYFPVGHPIIITENFGDPLEYFGIIKVGLKPPKDLLIPVLGTHVANKFLFDLSDKVAETLTTVELALAIEMGYEVTKIYEVHHWAEKSTDLFKEYVKNFYTMKLKAGGWSKFGLGGKLTPELEEARREFIRDHREYMELDVEYQTMEGEYNPAMYQVAKVCLNSLWGKFAQREDYTTTRDIHTLEDLDKILTDPLMEVSNWYMHRKLMDCDMNVHTLTYRTKTDFIQPSQVANVPLAVFTTSYARCRLYSAMRAVGFDRVLYCDTDSLVVSGDASDTLVLGQMLGDLTNELDAGKSIVDFVAMAPKTYGYLVSDGSLHFHAKGFSTRTFTDTIKSLTPMKRLISAMDEGVREVIPVPEMRMRQQDDYTITLTHGEKQFRAVDKDKRHFMEGGFSSFPYGWAALPGQDAIDSSLAVDEEQRHQD